MRERASQPTLQIFFQQCNRNRKHPMPVLSLCVTRFNKKRFSINEDSKNPAEMSHTAAVTQRWITVAKISFTAVTWWTNLTPSLRKLSSSVCTETSITLGKLRGGPLSWKWCLVLTWRANHGCWLEAHNKLESLNDCPKPMQASADRQRWNTPVRGFLFAPCLHDALALWIYLI